MVQEAALAVAQVVPLRNSWTRARWRMRNFRKSISSIAEASWTAAHWRRPNPNLDGILGSIEREPGFGQIVYGLFEC